MIKRNELENKLEEYFQNIFFDSSKEKSLSEILREKRNITPGSVAAAITGHNNISNFTDEELFWYAQACRLPDYENYFSPQEFKRYDASKISINKSIYPITFQNVIKVSEDQYVTTISASKLFHLYSNRVIVYNPVTQRAPRITTRGEKTSYSIFVNESSVRSIKSLLERGLFIPNDLTLNVREEDLGNCYYDDYDASFTLTEGTMDILDGYHRYQALIRCINDHPDYEITFVLNIMLFDEDKAKRYIAQQDKKNRIRPSYSKMLDNSRAETVIVNKLNNDNDSYLCQRFSALRNSRFDDKLDVGSAIDAVGEVFSPQDHREVIQIENFLVKNFNILLEDKELYNSFTMSEFKLALYFFSEAYKEDREPDFERLKRVIYNYNKIPLKERPRAASPKRLVQYLIARGEF